MGLSEGALPGAATSLPAASGGVKGKRSVCRGLQKTSLLRQAKFSQATTNGRSDRAQELRSADEEGVRADEDAGHRNRISKGALLIHYKKKGA